MTKFRDYFEKMLVENTKIFEEFRKIHLDYSIDRATNQDKFNDIGEKAVEIIREWDNRLCKNTERGMYSKFSANLSDKFWEEVRGHFPLIDRVGLKVDKPKNITDKFNLKKINV